MSDDKFISKLRKLKMKIVFGEVEFNISRDKLKEFKKSNQFKIYKKHYQGEVITGSTVLHVFDMLLRDPVDIDILDTKTRDTDIIRGEYPSDFPDGYRGSVKHQTGRIFKDFIYVDLFEPKTDGHAEIDGIKFDNVLNVLDSKIRLIERTPSITQRNKHINDISHIFTKFGI